MRGGNSPQACAAGRAVLRHRLVEGVVQVLASAEQQDTSEKLMAKVEEARTGLYNFRRGVAQLSRAKWAFSPLYTVPAKLAALDAAAADLDAELEHVDYATGFGARDLAAKRTSLQMLIPDTAWIGQILHTLCVVPVPPPRGRRRV